MLSATASKRICNTCLTNWIFCTKDSCSVFFFCSKYPLRYIGLVHIIQFVNEKVYKNKYHKLFDFQRSFQVNKYTFFSSLKYVESIVFNDIMKGSPMKECVLGMILILEFFLNGEGSRNLEVRKLYVLEDDSMKE